MLNVIAEIGNVVSSTSDQDILDYLVPDNNRFRHIIGLNFDTRGKKVTFEIVHSNEKGPLSKASLKKVAYVGSERGYRPQFSPTTENLTYLLSQTLPNLADFLPGHSQLRHDLQRVIAEFFVSMGQSSKQRYATVLNDQTLDTDGVEFIHTEGGDLKHDVAEYANALSKVLRERFGTKPKETLYTVLVDGQPVAGHPEYRAFLTEKNLESAFETSIRGTCSVCGRQTDVTQDTTRFLFKFYMTDKINFASHFRKENYYKAVALDKDCYQNVLLGERWIDQNLRTRLGGFGLYLLPQLVWADIEANRVFRLLERLPDSFNEVKNIRGMREREEGVRDRLEIMRSLEENPFLWNFLFFRKSQSAFKVLMLIKDVPPSRILELYRCLDGVDQTRQRFFPDSVLLDLDQIYWIVPIKKSGAELQEYRKVLQIYYNIFNGIPFDRTQLYHLYTGLAHLHRFQSYHLFQIGQPGSPDFALANDTLKWNLFFLFLGKLNLMKGGNHMSHEELEKFFPGELQQVFRELDYNSAQQGLALLGYVVGVVAWAQSQENLTSKPILGKINYQGMSQEKTVRLFNELFEKIHQYRRRIGYAERWWAAAKKLYEAGNPSEMTSDERVFYVLSGYALNMLQAKPAEVQSGRLGEESEEAEA